MVNEMKKPTKAIYAGSFDPVTQGHLWVIQAAADIFDQLIIAIGTNPNKKSTFTLAERRELIKDSLLSLNENARWCSIGYFDNKFLINYAAELQATHIVRGIRNIQDFEFERLMLNVNSDIQAKREQPIQTVYLIPPRYLAETSSSAVKALVGPEGWREVVRPMVTPCVFAALENMET